jgi:hypothetical protein
MIMKNFIGITTHNRPEYLELCLHKIFENATLSNTMVYVFDDGSENDEINRKITHKYFFTYEYSPKNIGISKAKNRCLDIAKCIKAENILLLDDDAFPTKINFIQFLTQISYNTGENHLQFVDDKYFVKKIDENISQYNNFSGWILYLNNKVLNSGIRFNEKYDTYGFEHAEFSLEIFKQGFNKIAASIMPNRMKEYFHCVDFSGDYEDYFKTNNIILRSSISDQEKNKYIKINQGKFNTYQKNLK